ncbi:MAG TPA: DUF6599 family protein [Candidatus Dormibacteraeota bacterium]|nr:DUF6599 family protein [Candidatus Dormibacteraeota bacterium]
MRLRSLLVFSLFIAPGVFAQDLPARLGRWTATSPVKTISVPASNTEVFVEAGLVGSECREYSSGGSTIRMAAYRFHDSSGAYQGFTHLFKPEMAGRGSDSTVLVGTDRLFLVGSTVLVAENGNTLSAEEINSVQRQFRAKADPTPPPPIRDYLPTEGRIAGSERYALGAAAFRSAATSLDRAGFSGLANDVGFSSGAEAMFARYRTLKNDAVLLLIIYPTPQLAGLHWKHLERGLQGVGTRGETSIERKGSLLAIALSPSTGAFAEALRSTVNYETQVTWNEPSHTVTDPPITTVLAKIIISTGVFMLVAIVFGVAFGGVRVITKMLFPGKIFDRPEQMDVLQLGLSGKRINSGDFR